MFVNPFEPPLVAIGAVGLQKIRPFRATYLLGKPFEGRNACYCRASGTMNPQPANQCFLYLHKKLFFLICSFYLYSWLYSFFLIPGLYGDNILFSDSRNFKGISIIFRHCLFLNYLVINK